MKNKFRSSENSTGIGGEVLIPVDFTSKDIIAFQVGFALAQRWNVGVTILHASPIATSSLFPQFPDEYNGLDNVEPEIEEIELDIEMENIDSENIRKIHRTIDSKIKDGLLPEIKYRTISAPGMPEEVIAEYCEEKSPAIVVMATRNLSRRREELIGSVTAEVIDSCRVPVFSIPENYQFQGLKEIQRLCMFCYLEGGDLIGMETLMRMFENPKVNVYLFPATSKLSDDVLQSRMKALNDTLVSEYPDSTFELVKKKNDNLRLTAEELFDNDHIQLIIAPNKKRNAFLRFFHPGLPHRILFEKDIPLLAIPV